MEDTIDEQWALRRAPGLDPTLSRETILELWDLYGFSANPYRYTPLEASAFDDALYESRGDAESQFASSVTDVAGGVLVISGDLGTGKTSFANVLQHRMLAGTAGFGLRPLPSFFPSQFVRNENATTFARKVVENTIRSVKKYCEIHRSNKLPAETKRYHDWLFGGATQAVAIAGTGRTVSPVSATTVEVCADILGKIADEFYREAGVDGLFICLDNAESIGADNLAELLKDLRDSLLSLPRIWWIIIGPSNLYAQIQEHNKAVSQRIIGQGIELDCLTGQGFHDLIQRRVRAYGIRPEAKAPLSQNVHQRLHDAAAGELRFSLKMGHDALVEMNAQMYKYVQDQYTSQGKKPQTAAILSGVKALLKERMGGTEQFPDSYTDAAIVKTSVKALRRLDLQAHLAAALQQLGAQTFSLSDLTNLGVPDGLANAECLETLVAAGVVRNVQSTQSKKWALKHHAHILAGMSKLAAASK